MSGRCDSCGEVGDVWCGGCLGDPTVHNLQSALAAERARAEKAEAEITAHRRDYGLVRDKYDEAEARAEMLEKALREAEPYADHTAICMNTATHEWDCTCDLAGWLGRIKEALEASAASGQPEAARLERAYRDLYRAAELEHRLHAVEPECDVCVAVEQIEKFRKAAND